MTPTPPPKADGAATRQAIAWLVRLTDDEIDPGALEELERWCSADASRAAALGRVIRVWEASRPAAQRLAGDLVRPVTGDARRGAPRARTISRRAFLGGAVAASAAASAWLLARPPLHLWPSLSALAADYRTGTGEQRRVTVPGGASVELNTRTALRLPAPGREALELLEGEAVVDAPMDPRAISIVAGAGRCTARGATFDLRRAGEGAVVTCLAGEVRVEHRGRAVVLPAQRQVAYGQGDLSQAVPADTAAVTAWRRGMLVFRDEPLARVVEEVNRYRPGRILLLDGELGARRVSAQLQLHRLDDMIAQVCLALGARVRSLPGGLVLLT